ncbi:juvenile hormone esterase-like [Lutzomyia longipalpis]|uniref:juvenile hormone esterase-like n=1 Tax=Lutzomyia longipalpis TaxID=7200 RepID=UPI00248368F5|nr:juvenile hormone esterase-like [Lutzomyia longipalpis]
MLNFCLSSFNLKKKYIWFIFPRMWLVVFCSFIAIATSNNIVHGLYHKGANGTEQYYDKVKNFDYYGNFTSDSDSSEYNTRHFHSNANRNKEFKRPATTQIFTVDVCAKAGCIRGKIENGRLRPYDAFYGIPYAEPPVGELRLENPVPYRGWEGYWDATYPRSDCTQRNVFLYTQPILGSEDCLYLNVYRPKLYSQNKKNAKKLPVMVWIHGGSLMSFSSSPDQFGPEYLMDNGEVILVTLNYRLGMFGLLCSGDEAVKGNFALKDQQLALKWVAANIESFGGDTNSITLLGQSSGASSVQHHIMNPVSSALFHRAVLMSGNSIAPWAFSKDWALKFRLSARNSGFEDWETASTYELAKHFKKLHALQLVLAFDELFISALTPPTPLRPCVEGDWEGAFLRDDPRKIWAEGRFEPKPILIGTTTEDGTFSSVVPTNHRRLEEFNENIYEYLPIQMDFDPKYAEDVIKFYLGKDYIDDSNVESYYKLVGDRAIVYPMITVVNQYLQYADVQKNPIYIYEFGFQSQYTFVKYYTGKNINLGVSHIDDLIYLFTMSAYFPLFDPKSPEGVMSDIYVRTIVNFATRGEVKAWASYTPCTSNTNTPFCDRQLFRRFTKSNPDSVIVSVTDQIDVKMVELWDRVDRDRD